MNSTTTTTKTPSKSTTKKKSPPKSMMVAMEQSQEWINKLNNHSDTTTTTTTTTTTKTDKRKFIIYPKKKNKQPRLLLNEDHKEQVGYDATTKTYYTISNSTYKANHLIYDKSNKANVPIAKNINPSREKTFNYLTIPIDELQEVIGLEKDEGYYEILGDGYRKLYFDLDIKGGNLENYIVSKRVLFNILNKEGIDTSKYVEYGSERIKNDLPYVSYHIIINNNTFFSNSQHIKDYTKYLFRKYVELEQLVDDKVYCKYQLFRLPYQSKQYNKTSILKFSGEIPDIKDYLIGLFTEEPIELYGDDKVDDVKVVFKHNEAKTKVVRDKTLSSKDKKHMDYNQTYYRACEGTIITLGLNDGSLDYLIKSIPNNSKVSYQIFSDVGMALRRTCKEMEEPQAKGLTLWTNWTKQYNNNITEDDLNDLYNSYSTNEKGKTTLLRLARMFNKDFDKTDRTIAIENYYNIPNDPTRFSFVEVDTNKLGTQVDIASTVKSNKIVCLKSPMGTGKTYGLRPLLKDKHARIVYMSCKRSFASAMFNDLEPFGFKNYLLEERKDDIKDIQKLLISIESCKFAPNETDYLIMDECETIFANISSEMMRSNQPVANLQKLINLIRNSQSVIFMDAFISTRTITFIEDLIEFNIIPECKVKFVNNNYKYPERTVKRCNPIMEGKEVVQTAKYGFINTILDSVIEQKKKIAVCLGSKILLDELEHQFVIYNQSIENNQDKQQIRMRCYSSTNPLRPCDVNKEWENIDVLIYSPTITAGINCSTLPEEKQFDKLFLYIGSSGNPLARDIIQSHKRVRFFKDSEIILLESSSNFDGYKPQTKEEVENQDGIYQKELGIEETTIKTTPDLAPFKNVMINNILERNINDKNLTKVMNYFFKQENITNCGKLLPRLATLAPELADVLYEEIEDIEEQEFNNLMERYTSTKHNKDYLNEIEHEQRAKYDYKHNLTKKSLTDEERSSYWNDNVNGNFGDKEKMYNTQTFLRALFYRRIKPFIATPLEKEEEDTNPLYNKYGEFMKKKNIRQSLILEIFKQLDLYTVVDEGENPDITETDNLLEYDKEFTSLQLLELKPLLDKLSVSTINLLLDSSNSIRVKKSKTGFTLANITSIITMIMKTHFDLTIIKQGRKQIRVDGKKKEIYRYKLGREVGDKKNPVVRENGFNIFRYTFKEFSE